MHAKRNIGWWFDRPSDLPGWLRISLTIVAPVTFFGVIIGAWFGARAVDRLIGVEQPIAPVIGWVLACPFLVVGLALMFWSVSRFVLARGTPVPFNPPPTLVTTGPYRYTRHPMFTGLIIAIFGLGIGFQSPAVTFILLPLTIAAFAWEVRVFEEPQLQRRFGDAYLEYQKRVPMIFPRIKKNGL
ncbi:MAG: isoprenylcysteine carboxylmethyltransferase family protein [Candidatus Zixiibacteriota bacterium]